jgi:hypothetical protein
MTVPEKDAKENAGSKSVNIEASPQHAYYDGKGDVIPLYR